MRMGPMGIFRKPGGQTLGGILLMETRFIINPKNTRGAQQSSIWHSLGPNAVWIMCAVAREGSRGHDRAPQGTRQPGCITAGPGSTVKQVRGISASL